MFDLMTVTCKRVNLGLRVRGGCIAPSYGLFNLKGLTRGVSCLHEDFK